MCNPFFQGSQMEKKELLMILLPGRLSTRSGDVDTKIRSYMYLELRERTGWQPRCIERAGILLSLNVYKWQIVNDAGMHPAGSNITHSTGTLIWPTRPLRPEASLPACLLQETCMWNVGLVGGVALLAAHLALSTYWTPQRQHHGSHHTQGSCYSSGPKSIYQHIFKILHNFR